MDNRHGFGLLARRGKARQNFRSQNLSRNHEGDLGKSVRQTAFFDLWFCRVLWIKTECQQKSALSATRNRNFGGRGAWCNWKQKKSSNFGFGNRQRRDRNCNSQKRQSKGDGGGHKQRRAFGCRSQRKVAQSQNRVFAVRHVQWVEKTRKV